MSAIRRTCEHNYAIQTSELGPTGQSEAWGGIRHVGMGRYTSQGRQVLAKSRCQRRYRWNAPNADHSRFSGVIDADGIVYVFSVYWRYSGLSTTYCPAQRCKTTSRGVGCHVWAQWGKPAAFGKDLRQINMYTQRRVRLIRKLMADEEVFIWGPTSQMRMTKLESPRWILHIEK